LADSLADMETADPARSETNSSVFLIPTRFVLSTMRVLLAEGKHRDARQIVSTLRPLGYAADRVHGGIEAELALSTTRYAPVLINMVLPRKSGSSILLWLCRVNSEVPVLTFGQDDRAADRVNALNAGADDHLCKPFDVRELVARCRSLLRRSQGRSSEQMRCRDLFVDPASKTVIFHGNPIATSPRESALLLQLNTHRGVQRSSWTLEDCIYGWKEEIESNAIQVHVSNLRKKLGGDTIVTVRGIGYVIR
jgi:two-component system response regulator QseB